MKFFRVLVLVSLVSILFGCTTLPPRVLSAELGTQVNSGKIAKPTTMFEPGDRMIHLVVQVDNVVAGTTVGAKWYSVTPPRRLLFESELALDVFNTSADFTLTTTGDWTPGQYEVVVFLDGKQSRTLAFSVKGE